MAKVKAFIDTDVLTEAKKRIHHIFDIFDTIAVCFSGGKDSLAVLHLVREVAMERAAQPGSGINPATIKIPVIFRDEELIPDEVINFVDEYRRLPWIDMRWYTVPLASTKYIMGVCHSYVQWDPARGPDRWVRPKPAWGISLPEGDARVFDQYTMDSFAAQGMKGKVALLTGVRAAESLIRYRACVNKLNENYITGVLDPNARNVMLAKPIFDWQENDVFRYFYDRKIRYCQLYDQQLYAGLNMRVSSPLHAEAAKKFDRVRTTTPDFYQRVIDVFPEMLAHERYYRDMDRAAITRTYGQTYEGVRLWIDENITDEKQYDLAVRRFDGAMIRAVKNPALYPPDWMLSAFTSGAYKREIMPKGRT